jgi:effector-binding domain-containing protein
MTSLRSTPAQPAVAIRLQSAPHQMGANVSSALRRIADAIRAAGTSASGAAYTRYLAHHPEDGYFELEIGIPVSAVPTPSGDLLATGLPGGLAVSLVHLGPYESLGASHSALSQDVRARGLQPVGGPWESYVVGPADDADSSAWRTELFQPVVSA